MGRVVGHVGAESLRAAPAARPPALVDALVAVLARALARALDAGRGRGLLAPFDLTALPPAPAYAAAAGPRARLRLVRGGRASA